MIILKEYEENIDNFILSKFSSFKDLNNKLLEKEKNNFINTLNHYNHKIKLQGDFDFFSELKDDEFENILNTGNYLQLEELAKNPYLSTERLKRLLDKDVYMYNDKYVGFNLLELICNHQNVSLDIIEEFITSKKDEELNEFFPYLYKVYERIANSDLIFCFCSFIETFGNNIKKYSNLKQVIFSKYFSYKKSDKLLEELSKDNNEEVKKCLINELNSCFYFNKEKYLNLYLNILDNFNDGFGFIKEDIRKDIVDNILNDLNESDLKNITSYSIKELKEMNPIIVFKIIKKYKKEN